MALYWDWSKKCGEADFRQEYDGEVKEYTISLYEGNAFLIFLNEYQEDGKDMYNMYSFMVDEQHAKACLGLTKGNDNIFDTGFTKLVRIRINKDVYSKTNKLVGYLIKAFDKIDIQVYSNKAEV